MALQDREAMAPMGSGMGLKGVRMGLPRAVMGNARPIALSMPAHVVAMVEAIRSFGVAHGNGMSQHGQAHGASILIHCNAGLR